MASKDCSDDGSQPVPTNVDQPILRAWGQEVPVATEPLWTATPGNFHQDDHLLPGFIAGDAAWLFDNQRASSTVGASPADR